MPDSTHTSPPQASAAIIPPKVESMAAADCLTTTVSFTASSLGNSRLTASPMSAVDPAKARENSRSTAPSASVIPNPQTSPAAHTSRQGTVSSS